MVRFKVGGEANFCPRARTIVWFTGRSCSGVDGSIRSCSGIEGSIRSCSGIDGTTAYKNENVLQNHVHATAELTGQLRGFRITIGNMCFVEIIFKQTLTFAFTKTIST